MAKRKGKRATRTRGDLSPPSADLKICTECKRDPREYPQAKVVAKGLCNADYAAAMRRQKRVDAGLPAEPEPKRSGVTARITVGMSTDLKERIARVADACKQSDSQWAAEVLEKAVARVERDLGLTPAA